MTAASFSFEIVKCAASSASAVHTPQPLSSPVGLPGYAQSDVTSASLPMAAFVSANAFGLTPANGGLPATVLSKAVAFFAP